MDLSRFRGSPVHDVLAVLYVCGVFTPILAGILLFLFFEGVLTFVLCFILVAISYHGITILAHETYHRTIFRSKRINDVVGAWLFSFPVFGEFELLKHEHLVHHRYVGTLDDPDRPLWNWPRPQRKSYVRHLLYTLTGLPFVVSVLSLGRGRETNTARQSPNRAAVTSSGREKVKIALVQTLLLALFTVTVGWWFYFLLWVLPIITLGRVIAHLRAFVEHIDGAVRIYPDANYVERFVLGRGNFHLHGVHHAFPSEPWFALPARRHEAGRRYPAMIVGTTYSAELVAYFSGPIRDVEAREPARS